MEDLREDYEDVRQLHYESMRERRYVSLEKARGRRLNLSFANEFTPGMLNIIIFYNNSLIGKH